VSELLDYVRVELLIFVSLVVLLSSFVVVVVSFLPSFLWLYERRERETFRYQTSKFISLSG